MKGHHRAIRPYLSCGSCPACLRGKPNCCLQLQVFGVHVDGGLREFAVLPAAYGLGMLGQAHQHAPFRLPFEHRCGYSGDVLQGDFANEQLFAGEQIRITN